MMSGPMMVPVGSMERRRSWRAKAIQAATKGTRKMWLDSSSSTPM
jgi:hypothetical protein